MATKDDSNILEKFGLKNFAKPREYKAYESTGKRQLYIGFRNKRGDSCLFSYAYIKKIQYKKADGAIHITGGNFIATLQGRNLDKALPFLHDETLRYFQEFNFRRFKKPESDQPIIEMITISKFSKAESDA